MNLRQYTMSDATNVDEEFGDEYAGGTIMDPMR